MRLGEDNQRQFRLFAALLYLPTLLSAVLGLGRGSVARLYVCIVSEYTKDDPNRFVYDSLDVVEAAPYSRKAVVTKERDQQDGIRPNRIQIQKSASPYSPYTWIIYYISLRQVTF